MDRPRRPHGRRLSTDPGLRLPLVAELLGRTTFPAPGSPVACAVSGGADSLALLVLAVAAGCDVTAVHVDHGLRPGSAAEADVVAAAAARFGAAFEAKHVRVADGPNLEERARVLRASVLLPDVLTGHTADDRAETVLLHLIRGAGPKGAVGIWPSPSKPLLALRRHETVALCAALGLEPVDDPSNRDGRFRRNRVRHELLPLLRDIGERDPVPVLVHNADLFVDVHDAIEAAAEVLDPTDAKALAAAPKAVAGAAVQQWLLAAGVGDGHPVGAATVERVLEVARGAHVATEVAGGWRVARSAGRLSVAPPTTWQDAAHE